MVGSDDMVTTDHISRMPYLRNTLKETLRFAMHFPASFAGLDLKLVWIWLPKNTLVTIDTYSLT